MMKHCSRAPLRFDPAGGGTDAPPYRFDHGGDVVNVSINKYAYALFEERPAREGVTIVSQDFKQSVHVGRVEALLPGGRLGFLKGFLRRFVPSNGGALLVTRSDVPPGTGLGGSGALGVAITAVLAKAYGQSLSQTEIARVANDIERNDLGFAGGSQDSYTAVGGIKHIHYPKEGKSTVRRILLPQDALRRFERDSLLIYTGTVHLSGRIHDDIKAAYQMEHSPVIAAMDNLKDAARKMVVALEAGDFEAYAEQLNRSRMNHYQLHESCDNDDLRKYFSTLEPDIVAGKTCGAGGGGYIVVLCKPGQASVVTRKAEALGASVSTVIVDQEGVTTWKEPSFTAEEIEEMTALADQGSS